MKLPFALLFAADDLPRIRETTKTAWGRELFVRWEAVCKDTLETPQGSLNEAVALAFWGLLHDSREHLEASKQRVLPFLQWDAWAKGKAMLLRGDWASQISLALDWGWEAYTEDEARDVLEALVANAIENGDPAAPLNSAADRGRNQYAIRSLAEFADYAAPAPFHSPIHTTNNWDVVTSGGLMLAATTVEKAVTQFGVKMRAEKTGFALDAARFDRWHNLARERLQNFASRCYSTGGQYNEGPGYYSYGTLNALLGMEVARRHRGANLYTLGMLRSPLWQRELYPWGIADGAMNFNDSTLPAHPTPELVARLAAESRNAECQGFFLDLLPNLKSGSYKAFSREALLYRIPLIFIWADPGLAPAPPPAKTYFDFAETGDIVGRTGRDPGKEVHWVFRCGKWNGAHTHLDRNNLVVSAYGERLLTDAGCYNNYFGPPHTTYHKQTLAHNCVLVDSAGQTGSKALPTHGRILHSASRPDGGALVIGDAKQCYTATSAALRAVQFEPKGFWIVYDYLKADAEHFDCLWHFNNEDGLGVLEEKDGGFVFKRPKATLVIIPILAPDSFQRSTGWISVKEDAAINLSIRRTEGRFLHLLVALHPGEELSWKFDNSPARRLSFDLRGEHHTLEAPPDTPGWIFDGENRLPAGVLQGV